MLALTSPPLYDASPFLSWLTIGATIVVPTLFWYLSSRRRVLTYMTVTAAPLLGSGLPGMPDTKLEVLMDSKPLADAQVAMFRVHNRSRRQIPSKDFDDKTPLWFDLGAKLRYVGYDAEGTIHLESLHQEATRIGLGPVLIGGGQWLRLMIITEGTPHITCPYPSLIGVKVRELQPPDYRVTRSLRVAIALTFGAAVFWVYGIYNLLDIEPPSREVGITALIIGMALLMLSTVVLNAFRRRFGTTRL